MTSNDPRRCGSCGRQSWPGDQFCPGCGTRNIDDDAAHSPLIDFDDGVSQIEDTPAQSSRRDSMIGIGALCAVVAFVALLFVAGNSAVGSDSPEDVSEADSATEELAGESTPEPTVEPTPEPTAESTAGEPDPTPRPTRTPRPTVQENLAEFVTTIDMGEGWLVTRLSRKTAIAVNLQTGETIETQDAIAGYRDADAMGGTVSSDIMTSYALASGVLMTGFGGIGGDDGLWSFAPWHTDTAGLNGHLDLLRGSPIRLYDDATVGPVIVTVGANLEGAITATSLREGTTKAVEIADRNTSLAGRWWGDWGFQSAGDAFLADDGKSIYSWTWDDGWTRIADGQLTHVQGAMALTVDCDGPANCTSALISTDGTPLAEFALDIVGSGRRYAGPIVISPSGDKLAHLRFGHDRAGLPELDIISGDGATLATTASDDNTYWEDIVGWSPNERYVMVHGHAGLFAIDVETGSSTSFRMSNSYGPGSNAVFIDHIDQ